LLAEADLEVARGVAVGDAGIREPVAENLLQPAAEDTTAAPAETVAVAAAAERQDVAVVEPVRRPDRQRGRGVTDAKWRTVVDLRVLRSRCSGRSGRSGLGRSLAELGWSRRRLRTGATALGLASFGAGFGRRTTSRGRL